MAKKMNVRYKAIWLDKEIGSGREGGSTEKEMDTTQDNYSE